MVNKKILLWSILLVLPLLIVQDAYASIPVIETNTNTHAFTGAGTSQVFTAPSGTSDGDILIIAIAIDGTAANPSISEGGWTRIINLQEGSVELNVFWKRANSESGDYTVTWTGSEGFQGFIYSVSGATTSGDPFEQGSTSTGSTDPSTANSFTTITSNTLALAFHGIDRNRITSGQADGGTGWTTQDIEEQGSANGATLGVSIKNMASPAVTLDSTQALSTADGWATQQLALKEDSGPQTFTLPLTEQVDIVDAQSKATTKFLTEQVDISDQVNTSVMFSKLLSEQINITDFITSKTDFTKPLVEQIDIIDQLVTKTEFSKILTEQIDITDQLSTNSAFTKTLTELVNITDLVDLNSVIVISLTEQIDVSDSTTTKSTLFKSLTEQVDITDQLSTGSTFIKSLIEQVDITDQLVTGSFFIKSLIEQIEITDTIAINSNLNIFLTEQIAITEQINTKSTLTKSLTETINVNDSVSSSIFTPPQAFEVSLTETINITDVITTSLFTPPQAFEVSLNETVNVTDLVELSLFTPPQAFAIQISETVEIGDVILLVIESLPSNDFTVFLVETLQINDSVTLSIVSLPPSNDLIITLVEIILISDSIDGVTPIEPVIKVKKNGRPCGDCEPPKIVQLCINETCYDKPKYFNLIDQNIPVNKPLQINFTISENRGSQYLGMIQVTLGLSDKQFVGQGDNLITHYLNFNMENGTVILDKNNSLVNVTTSITIGDKFSYVTFNFTPTKATEGDKLGLNVSDDRRNAKQTFFKGLTIFDDSPLVIALELEPEECAIPMVLDRDWCGWSIRLGNQSDLAMRYFDSGIIQDGYKHKLTFSWEDLKLYQDKLARHLRNGEMSIANYYPWESPETRDYLYPEGYFEKMMNYLWFGGHEVEK